MKKVTIFIFFSALLCIVLVGPAAAASAEDSNNPWELIQTENHFVMLRHALAPGTGDPAEFTLRRCETQRNLSQEGRDQASRIGKMFRDNGITRAAVFSSQWCRCIDTAALLDLGPVVELPSLNSFFQDFSRKDATMKKLSQWLTEQSIQAPLVLVTHQVNITALTGIFPSSGNSS